MYTRNAATVAPVDAVGVCVSVSKNGVAIRSGPVCRWMLELIRLDFPSSFLLSLLLAQLLFTDSLCAFARARVKANKFSGSREIYRYSLQQHDSHIQIRSALSLCVLSHLWRIRTHQNYDFSFSIRNCVAVSRPRAFPKPIAITNNVFVCSFCRLKKAEVWICIVHPTRAPSHHLQAHLEWWMSARAVSPLHGQKAKIVRAQVLWLGK